MAKLVIRGTTFLMVWYQKKQASQSLNLSLARIVKAGAQTHAQRVSARDAAGAAQAARLNLSSTGWLYERAEILKDCRLLGIE